MHRTSRGFGLVGVAATVLFLVITAILGTSAKAADLSCSPALLISHHADVSLRAE